MSMKLSLPPGTLSPDACEALQGIYDRLEGKYDNDSTSLRASVGRLLGIKPKIGNLPEATDREKANIIGELLARADAPEIDSIRTELERVQKELFPASSFIQPLKQKKPGRGAAARNGLDLF